MLSGKTIVVSSPQGRFASDALLVTGKKLRRVFSHGKHLFYDFGKDKILHVHLGRLGHFREKILKRGEALPTPTPATRMRLLAPLAVVDLSGPTACEVLDQEAVDAILDRLGPDLLNPKADSNLVFEIFRRRATPIGALLMDQSIVSGIGNIFRAEILYLCGIHPQTPAEDLTQKQLGQIWRESVRLMRIGVKVGRIVTVPLSGLKKPVDKLTRDERFNVYKRKVCKNCGAKVMSVKLAGRPCYYCSKEQVMTGKPR